MDQLPKQTKFGPPSGPRKKDKASCNGSYALKWRGLEATAKHLSLPKTLRQFKSDNELAEHYGVSRMTIFRWKNHPDVLRRAEFLSLNMKRSGDLVLRREWPEIAEALADQAKSGNVSAIKLYADLAFVEERRQDQSGLSSLSMSELALRSEISEAASMVEPTWMIECRAHKDWPVVEVDPGSDEPQQPE